MRGRGNVLEVSEAGCCGADLVCDCVDVFDRNTSDAMCLKVIVHSSLRFVELGLGMEGHHTLLSHSPLIVNESVALVSELIIDVVENGFAFFNPLIAAEVDGARDLNCRQKVSECESAGDCR